MTKKQTIVAWCVTAAGICTIIAATVTGTWGKVLTIVAGVLNVISQSPLVQSFRQITPF